MNGYERNPKILESYLKYQSRVLREKERKYNKQNGAETDIPNRAMKLLKEHTIKEMIEENQNYFKKKNKNKNLERSKANKAFKKKQNKIRELLKRRHNFKPEFSIIPFAKQIIQPDNELSLLKIENIIKSKKTLKETNKIKFDLHRKDNFITKNIADIKKVSKKTLKQIPIKYLFT